MNTFDRRRTTLIALTAGPALAALPSLARAQFRTPEAGKEYVELPKPVPTESGNKIEVLDFFQYSCPHCYNFLPDLTAWKKRLPSDVAYRYVPTTYDARTTPHARIAFALEELGRLEDMHAKVFEAFHVGKKSLIAVNEISDFMVANGIGAQEWSNAWVSQAVTAKVQRANVLWRAYQVEGTPAVGCDGLYVAAPVMVRSSVRALQVVDFLIAKRRAARGGK